MQLIRQSIRCKSLQYNRKYPIILVNTIKFIYNSNKRKDYCENYILGGNHLDKILLRKAAAQSVALMLVVIVLSLYIKEYNEVVISASNTDGKTKLEDLTDLNVEKEALSVKDELLDTRENANTDKADDITMFEEPIIVFKGAEINVSNDILEKFGEQYLVIRKPEGDGFQVSLEDIYSAQKLKMVISGLMDNVPDINYVGRVQDQEVFIGEPSYIENQMTEEKDDGSLETIITRNYGNDPVNGITIATHIDEAGNNVCEIELQLNHVYVHILYEDENYYYIDLKRPKDVYDKILVIDAGHGGKDPGAISKDERTYEKSINLKILLALKERLDKDNIKVYYTRLKDDTLFLRPRVTLANDVESDFFISIHSNSSVSSKPNGTEILYCDHVNNNIMTKDLAKIFSEEISKVIPLKKNGIMKMKDDDVFILYKATVPAIIIETAYMSNNYDMEYLLNEDSTQELAEGIYNGIRKSYELLMPNKQY